MTPLPQVPETEVSSLRSPAFPDRVPEAALAAVAPLVAHLCAAPLSLVYDLWQPPCRVLAHHGFAAPPQAGAGLALWAAQAGLAGVFHVEDALQDTRLASDPLLLAEGVRFCAGVALRRADGQVVGCLLAMDRVVRPLLPAQAQALQTLAWLVQAQWAAPVGEASYRALVETQTEMVSLATAQGVLLYVNPQYAAHFGMQPADMVGRSLYDFVAVHDQPAVRAQIETVLREGGNRQGENRMVAADGSEKWVSWTNAVQHDALGTPLLNSVGRDVTAQRLAERALQASESFLEKTGQVARIGGWEMDMARQTLAWSEQTKRIHEVEADFVPTVQNVNDFYPADAMVELQAAAQRAMQTGQAWDLEVPLVTGKGRQIWVRAQGEVQFEQGAPVRLFGTVQEITERVVAEKALRVLTTIFDKTTDLVVQTDRAGRISYMNPAVRQFTGLGADAPVGHLSFEDFNTPQTNALYQSTILPVVHADGVWLGVTTVYGEGKRTIPVSHMVIAHTDKDGRVEHYSAVMRDISALVDIQQELLQQTATLRSVTEAIPAGVAVVGADERIKFVNSAFERWHGSPRGVLVGRYLWEALGAEEYARTQHWTAQALAGETVTYEKEFVGNNRSQNLLMTHIPLRSEAGVANGFVAVGQDITNHKRESVRLLKLTQRDPLTGVFNRAGLRSYTDHHVREGLLPSTAVLYVDLDYFKEVNDQYGHPVGDQLLQLFAQRLLQLVRPSDAVARLGGDEFLVVVLGIKTLANAERVADKVLKAAAAPFHVGDLQLQVGASVGIGLGSATESGGWDALIARADGCLYAAKKAGKGTSRGPRELAAAPEAPNAQIAGPGP